MTFSLTIPGRLSGTNDIIRMAAWNRYAGGAKRKKEKELCAWHIRHDNAIHKAHFTNAVRVSLAWIEPNAKRDLDNITGGLKVILDALVMCKIIPNDSREWVKAIEHRFPEPDKKKPRIEVTLTDIETLSA